MLNPGQVLSREQLLDHVWGYDFDPGSNVVDVYVGYLRRKVGSRRHRDRARHGLPLPAGVTRPASGVAGTSAADLEAREAAAGLPREHRLERVDDLVRRRAGRAGSRLEVGHDDLGDLVRHAVAAASAGSATTCG